MILEGSGDLDCGFVRKVRQQATFPENAEAGRGPAGHSSTTVTTVLFMTSVIYLIVLFLLYNILFLSTTFTGTPQRISLGHIKGYLAHWGLLQSIIFRLFKNMFLWY